MFLAFCNPPISLPSPSTKAQIISLRTAVRTDGFYCMHLQYYAIHRLYWCISILPQYKESLHLPSAMWLDAASSREKWKLQCTIKPAEKIIGCSLPSLEFLYVTGTKRGAGMISGDTPQPAIYLFRLCFPNNKNWTSFNQLLPTGYQPGCYHYNAVTT